VAWKFRLPKRISNLAGRGSELPMEYLSPLYSVRITIVEVVEKQIYNARPPTWRAKLSGFAATDSKFLSIVHQVRMVSSGDDEVYTGSGLRGLIPYVQCVAAMFLSQVCS
jgi:hypothetical protein